MSQYYISSIFSPAMLARQSQEVSWTPVTRKFVQDQVHALKPQSVVRQEAMADIFSQQLDYDIRIGSGRIALKAGDVMFLGHYTGPSLRDDDQELPEGAEISWWQVMMK